MNRRLLPSLAALALVATACASDRPDATAPASSSASTSSASSVASLPASAPTATPSTITLVAYDSFPTKDTPLNAALDQFTSKTGIAVRVVTAGDAGTMVTKAVLTAGNPEGDVMWGVDNTLLSQAVDGKVFAPYTSPQAAKLPSEYTSLVPDGTLTPVDHGDVCINYDKQYFASKGIAPPATLDDLRQAQYKDLLVVENPSASSPGLAFLLATIARYGADGWQQYWKELRANGVEVVDSWDTAYYERFSGSAGSKGDRPLVVSYATSPPAEVIFGDPPPPDAPTASMTDSCFRQVEFAGVLRGTKHTAEAERLVDFLIGNDFQATLPLNLFVYPVLADVPLPPEFTKYAAVPDKVLTMAPADIAAHRTEWQDAWTNIVLH